MTTQNEVPHNRKPRYSRLDLLATGVPRSNGESTKTVRTYVGNSSYNGQWVCYSVEPIQLNSLTEDQGHWLVWTERNDLAAAGPTIDPLSTSAFASPGEAANRAWELRRSLEEEYRDEFPF